MKEIYQKVLKGDPITDEELAKALKFFDVLTTSLGVLGERFHFSWVEAMRIWTVLNGYQNARNNR